MKPASLASIALTSALLISAASCATVSETNVATAAAGSESVGPSEARAFVETFAPAGLALAVIENGDVTYMETFGDRNAQTGAPLTPDTVLPIASMTKAFIATALGVLVDDGKLDWDEPVVTYLPDFAMSDDYVTRNITVRDLLVHNSGLALGAGDLLQWPDGNATSAEVTAAMRYLPLETSFRQSWAYDNVLYSVAAEVILAASGKDWETLIRERIFAPLDMTSCVTGAYLADPGALAAEHIKAEDTGAYVAVAARTRAPDPAGGIACSITDLAKWAQFQLSDGTAPNGTPVLRAETLREIHTGVMPMRTRRVERELTGTDFKLYALGWVTMDFHGEKMVEHGGLGIGLVSNLAFLPERNAAVIAVSNSLSPVDALSSHVLSRIVRGAAAPDWLAFAAEREERSRQQANDEAEISEKTYRAAPSLPLADYAGIYRDPWYGDISVCEDGEGLAIHFTRSELLKGPLLPVGGDTFIARWPDRGLKADAHVTFNVDDGGPLGMSIKAASESSDFSYDYHHLAPVRVSNECF
jgi:CubicO group peptidase (beta-lactamase class C family)